MQKRPGEILEKARESALKREGIEVEKDNQEEEQDGVCLQTLRAIRRRSLTELCTHVSLARYVRYVIRYVT